MGLLYSSLLKLCVLSYEYAVDRVPRTRCKTIKLNKLNLTIMIFKLICLIVDFSNLLWLSSLGKFSFSVLT